ncbi:MAG: glycine cleavage system protein GcvH [Pseudomonadota bacterium]|nr:glycine cleavage system protein GcvH [Pseudomonadota bacterium]
MSDLKYTKDHEWVRVEGDAAIIGISDFAQEQLGDVVFVELPAIGKQFKQGDEAAVIESVKAASEVYAPVGGEVVEINLPLGDNPGLVNEAPTGEGWFLKIRISDTSELDALMDENAYQKFTQG